MTKRSASTLSLNDIEPTQPEIVDIRLSPEGLREVELKLGTRTIMVREADSMANYRMSRLVSELSENPHEDNLVQGLLVNLYAPLMACSFGDVPKPKEFMNIGKAAQELWIQTARKLNPHAEIEGLSWWYLLDELGKDVSPQAKQEDNKKKENG